MKRVICIFLTIIVMTTSSIPAFADEVKYEPQSTEGQNLYQYLNNKTHELLILRKNYCYMTFVEDFNSNALSLYLLEMTDKLINTGSKPDKKKYMETLVNVIAAYDLDRADNIANQKKMDNLKSLKDYAMDFSEMGKEAVSVLVGSSSQVSALENELNIAVSGVYTLADNTDNWIEAISNLETITQDYSEHDAFLALIENEAEGELREAASTLRSGMSSAFKIKLDTYADVSNENFRNYEEFFFSDVFFEVVKNMPEYENDEALKFFTDAGDSVISQIETLNSAWNLGKAIGTLVGDVVVGGENLINRTLEMVAIYNISLILQDKLLDVHLEFIKNVGKDKERELAEEYISFSNYLIGCRLRGEYCLYSTIAKDAGLLSWFDKESAEEAESWYNNKTEKILNIQKELLRDEDEDTWKEITEDTTAYPDETYISVIERLEKQYGPLEINICENDYDDSGYNFRVEADGLCYLELIDFNNDGVKELLAVAKSRSDDDYTVYLYTMEGEHTKELLASNNILNNYSDDFRNLYLKTNYDNESFIDGGFGSDGWTYYKIYGMKENTFGLISASSIIDAYNREDIEKRKHYYILNDLPDKIDSNELLQTPEVSEEEYKARIDEWIYSYEYDYKIVSLMDGLTTSQALKEDHGAVDEDELQRAIENVKELVGRPFNAIEPNNSDSWKQAYVDYIETDSDLAINPEWCTCGLIYVDNDEIPELVIEYSNEAAGTGVVSLKNGEITTYRFSRTGGIQYIEREGLIYNSVGIQGTIIDEFALLDDVGFHDYGHGYKYGENQDFTNFTYFSWNDTEVSEEKYNAQLTIFDRTRSLGWNTYSEEYQNNNYSPYEMRDNLLNNSF